MTPEEQRAKRILQDAFDDARPVIRPDRADQWHFSQQGPADDPNEHTWNTTAASCTACREDNPDLPGLNDEERRRREQRA